MGSSPGVVVWAAGSQLDLIEEALHHAAARVIAIGSATPEAAREMGVALGVPHHGALRHLLQHDDADILWLATRVEIEPDTLAEIRRRRLEVVSSEPHPTSIEQLPEEADGPGFRFVPRLRVSPGVLATQPYLESFGAIRSLAVTVGCAADEGTLFARLYDAIDLVLGLAGDVESVDAALTGSRTTVPESLAQLTGNLTMNLRLSKGRSAAVTASDHAGAWIRRLVILGEGGRLTIDGGGLEWIDPSGAIIESEPGTAPARPGELIGLEMARLLARGDAPEPPADPAPRLAVCEAARLSCRTGQGESPRTILTMHGRD